MANVLTLSDGTTVIDLLGPNYATNQGADRPNFAATLRVRQNAPAGTHGGILSYAERTSVLLPFSVWCYGNGAPGSMDAAYTAYDAIQTMLDTAQAYWLSPNHASGARVILERRFGDMSASRFYTVFRGELSESGHGIPEADGYVDAVMNLYAWVGAVS